MVNVISKMFSRLRMMPNGFGDVLPDLLEGCEVRRKGWPEGQTMRLVAAKTDRENGEVTAAFLAVCLRDEFGNPAELRPCGLEGHDLVAQDWKIVEP